MQCRLMRLLRIKHGITTRELARCTGLSQQRISELELTDQQPQEKTKALIAQGFHQVARSRQASHADLMEDLSKYDGMLLAAVEEGFIL